MKEEYKGPLDSYEAIEKIDPLVQDFLNTSQDSLIDEIENLISYSYYGYDDIARAIAEKIDGKTISSKQWSTLLDLLNSAVNGADPDMGG
ncbi:MAG: hypothetical protein KAU62_02030 [Candidatus Heimdallarchaeota archaeon]|nr:hypothetical protein [Candidatus Heimdallarchaeota archaeon]MCK4609912.1 hypothetical protein [Candidatus Heimdallarchaeota archaeon]